MRTANEDQSSSTVLANVPLACSMATGMAGTLTGAIWRTTARQHGHFLNPRTDLNALFFGVFCLIKPVDDVIGHDDTPEVIPHPDGGLGRGKRPVPNQEEHMFREPLIYKDFAVLANYIHVIIKLGLDETRAAGLFFSKSGQPFFFNLRDWRICRANKEFGWRADGFGVGLNALIGELCSLRLDEPICSHFGNGQKLGACTEHRFGVRLISAFGSSPVRTSKLCIPRAPIPNKSPISAIRFRSRQVSWTTGSIPLAFRIDAAAKLDI